MSKLDLEDLVVSSIQDSIDFLDAVFNGLIEKLRRYLDLDVVYSKVECVLNPEPEPQDQSEDLN